MPRLARLRSHASRSEGAGLDTALFVSYTEYVGFVLEPAKLLQSLNKLLLAGHSQQLTLEQLELVLQDCNAQPTDTPQQTKNFIDDVTGLQIPPPPPTEFYQGHWHRMTRMSAETFLARFWAPYVTQHPHMLFAPHLRKHDLALDNALRHRARSLGMSADDFYFEVGMLSQSHLAAPPATVARQAGLFRCMVAYQRLNSRTNTLLMKVSAQERSHG